MDSATVKLPTGLLHYQGVRSNTAALTELCDFGARRNPKRGFVFVSKVLGKHWPSRPSQMLALHRELAEQIPFISEPPGIVFVAMAETATGLGHAVFEAFLERSPRPPALFLQTTRYPLDGASLIEFQEEHSHATRQYLYMPQGATHRRLLARASTAVLIDDEATSGKTFVNLATALRVVCPALRYIVPMVLTDFTQGSMSAKLMAIPGIEQVHPVSLWRGAYEFVRDPDFRLEAGPSAFAALSCRRQHITSFTGRLGLDHAITIPQPLIEQCASLIDRPRALVLGTGECMHPAFRLALELECGRESRGVDIRLQSTTRSPLMQAGAISDVTHVADPYGEDIPNYLYNASMSAGARVVVVHETREQARIKDLVAQLDAIEFNLAELRVRAPPSGAR